MRRCGECGQRGQAQGGSKGHLGSGGSLGPPVHGRGDRSYPPLPRAKHQRFPAPLPRYFPRRAPRHSPGALPTPQRDPTSSSLQDFLRSAPRPPLTAATTHPHHTPTGPAPPRPAACTDLAERYSRLPALGAGLRAALPGLSWRGRGRCQREGAAEGEVCPAAGSNSPERTGEAAPT